MANKIPPTLRGIIAEQAGIVSRRQVLRAGLAESTIRSKVQYGLWQQVHLGATLRYGWADVATAPCETAAQVDRALRKRGYQGTVRACSPSCRALPAARSAEVRAGQRGS
jgi:hypothetical protein